MSDMQNPAAGEPTNAAALDVGTLDVGALEAEITSLAGHIAAATARFLALLAAFDAAGGWQQIGVTSCAQWLSWKCGLSPTTAREHLRVAKRLGVLPAIATTFAAGEISYSKVRALTRVATPETEADLVGAARNATAEQVHRLCRGLTRARSLDEAVKQVAAEAFTHHWNDDGTLRFSGVLSAESGALLLRAIESQREVLHGPLPEGETQFFPTSATDASGNAPTGPERPAGQLPDDTFRSRAALAARSDAEALVRIAVHALGTPPDAVSGSPVRLVVHTSEAALASSGPLGHLRPEPCSATEAPEPPGVRASATAEPDANAEPTAASDGTPEADVPDDRPGGTIESGPGLLPETVQRLACNAVFEAAGDADLPTPSPERDPQRAANRRQRRALLRRDGGCRFPGCTRTRGLQAHHVQHHSAGGPTTMSNLVLLCHHHHVVLHEGGWRLEWAIPLGGPDRSDPDRRTDLRVGTVVAVGPRGQRVVEAPPMRGRAGLLSDHHDRKVTPETILGSWDGSPLDLGYAVSVFAKAAARAEASAEPPRL